MTDVTPLPKNDFTHWSDDGREWREGILHATAMERLISWHNGKPVYQHYRKNAYLRILQSRHIRSSDRTEHKKSYYANQLKVSCPSCGANFIPDENHCCSYCGYNLQINNAKWVLISTEK